MKVLTALFCGVILGLVFSRFADNVLKGDAKPFEELLEDAREAVHNVGGCAALPAEAASLIRYAKENDTDWMSGSKLADYAPNMKKLEDTLPQSVSLRIVSKSSIYGLPLPAGIEIPEHVQIRFGTHFSYAHLLIFPPNTHLERLPKYTVNIGESVYLSRGNL